MFVKGRSAAEQRMEGLGGSGSGETTMEAVTQTKRERMLAAIGMLRNNQAQGIWRENG